MHEQMAHHPADGASTVENTVCCSMRAAPAQTPTGSKPTRPEVMAVLLLQVGHGPLAAHHIGGLLGCSGHCHPTLPRYVPYLLTTVLALDWLGA